MTTPTFADRIRDFRLRAGLNQRAFGDAIGVNFTYVSKMEKPGGPVPSREKIERAAEVLGLSASERDELLLLGEKVPSDVEQLLLRDPDAVVLYRSVRRLPEAEQSAILRHFVREIEQRYGSLTDAPRPADDGSDEPDGAGDPDRRGRS